MQPDDTARLGHLHDAPRKAVTFAAGRSRDDLDSDEMLTLALTKLVEIVGEAAKQVTQELEPCTQPYRGPMLRELEITWCTTTSTSTSHPVADRDRRPSSRSRRTRELWAPLIRSCRRSRRLSRVGGRRSCRRASGA